MLSACSHPRTSAPPRARDARPQLSILTLIIRNDSALLSFVSNPDQAVTVFAPTDDVFT